MSGKDISNSIVNQQKIINKFALNNDDIDIVDYFCDDGYSGYNFNRPAFNRMISKLRSGEDGVNCLIVKHLSRFGRDCSETIAFVQKEFPRLGIRFVTVEQDIDNYDNDIANQSIKLPLYSFADEVHLVDTSTKVRATLNAKRNHGLFVGSFLPYGYLRSEKNKGQLIIDKAVKNNVVTIFTEYLNGCSIQAIVDKLNSENIPSPMAHFVDLGVRKLSKNIQTDKYREWNRKHVKRILECDLLTGDMVQGKTTSYSYKVKDRIDLPREKWFIVKNTHESIISHEVFEKVQGLLNTGSRPKTRKHESSIMNGLVYCSECGHIMTRLRFTKDAKSYNYFVCSSFKNKVNKATTPCSSVKVREQDLLSAVKKSIVDNNVNIRDISTIIDAKEVLQEKKSKKEEYKDQIIELEKLIKDSKNDFDNRIIGIETYLGVKSSFERELTDLQNKYDLLCKNHNSRSSKEHITLSTSNEIAIKDLTRSKLLSVINKINVDKNKNISIVFSKKASHI